MGVSLAGFWLSCALVNQTILTLFAAIGMSGTFALYACTTTAALIFVYNCVPETKGKSFEEIDALFDKAN